jgi:glyoxylase-like metal-dependent hydrolase (beta-lactamase superfamily II)
MTELLPGVFHWTVVWPDLFPLESYWIRTAAGSVLIDPIERGGLGAIEEAGDVRAIILTNSWHERSARLFAKRTGASILVPAGDVRRFEDLDSFETYGDGDTLPADLIGIGVPGCSPGEHALLSPLHGGTLFVGDALGTTAKWTPGGIPLGAHPRGHPNPRQSLAHLLDHKFENLLPGHGPPIVGGAKTILADLIDHDGVEGRETR